MADNAIFMIEGGKALELVKHFVKDVRRVRNATIALSKEAGAERFMISSSSGVLTGVDFGGNAHHPDFKAPDRRGVCFPKKKSEWAERFRKQIGHDSASTVISRAFDIPLSLSYGKEEPLEGWRHIGYPLDECGFLYASEKGPFAMYVVDVPAEVAALKKQGYKVGEPAASFKMEFDGCRRIEKEEWDILVAQHKLAQRRAEAVA